MSRTRSPMFSLADAIASAMCGVFVLAFALIQVGKTASSDILNCRIMIEIPMLSPAVADLLNEKIDVRCSLQIRGQNVLLSPSQGVASSDGLNPADSTNSEIVDNRLEIQGLLLESSQSIDSGMISLDIGLENVTEDCELKLTIDRPKGVFEKLCWPQHVSVIAVGSAIHPSVSEELAQTTTYVKRDAQQAKLNITLRISPEIVTASEFVSIETAKEPLP